MFLKKSIIAIFVVLCMITLSSFNSFSQNAKIQITKPKNDSEVEGPQHLVRGKIENYSKGNVYVLVHPMATKLWWVQRPPSVINKDGSWQTLGYFGTESEGTNECFEIIAIITKKTLKEGQTIEITNFPPKDAIKSQMVTVQRTK